MTDLSNNRRARVKALIRMCGSQSAFADRLGVRNSYINQIAGPDPVRGIGDSTAQKIEKAFSLAPGTLDMPLPVDTHQDEILEEIVATLAAAGHWEKELVLSFSNWIMQQTQGAGTSAGTVYDVGNIDDGGIVLHNRKAHSTRKGVSNAVRGSNQTKGGR